MYCKKCGTELEKGARFCRECGTPAAEPETKPYQNNVPYQNNAPAYTGAPLNGSKRKKKKWVIPVVITCCVLVGLFMIVFIGGSIMSGSSDTGGLPEDAFVFPSTEESVSIRKAIQGTWEYEEEDEDSRTKYSLDLEGTEDFSLYEEHSSSLSRGGNMLYGRYAVDTEQDVIYLIPDDAETEDDVKEVIFDHDAVSGDINLMYKGVQLQRVK